MGNGHACACYCPPPTPKSRDCFSPCHYYSKWATTSTDTARGNVIQRIPGITMSETNNTARMIPMTEEDKRNLEEVLFNQHLRSMGLDFWKCIEGKHKELKSDLMMIQGLISMVPRPSQKHRTDPSQFQIRNIWWLYFPTFVLYVNTIDVSNLFISNKNNKNIGTTEKLQIMLLTAIYNKIKSIF